MATFPTARPWQLYATPRSLPPIARPHCAAAPQPGVQLRGSCPPAVQHRPTDRVAPHFGAPARAFSMVGAHKSPPLRRRAVDARFLIRVFMSGALLPFGPPAARPFSVGASPFVAPSRTRHGVVLAIQARATRRKSPQMEPSFLLRGGGCCGLPRGRAWMRLGFVLRVAGGKTRRSGLEDGSVGMAAWRQIWEDGTADTDLRLPPSGKGCPLAIARS